jgi:hypothetical protein
MAQVRHHRIPDLHRRPHVPDPDVHHRVRLDGGDAARGRLPGAQQVRLRRHRARVRAKLPGYDEPGRGDIIVFRGITRTSTWSSAWWACPATPCHARRHAPPERRSRWTSRTRGTPIRTATAATRGWSGSADSSRTPPHAASVPRRGTTGARSSCPRTATSSWATTATSRSTPATGASSSPARSRAAPSPLLLVRQPIQRRHARLGRIRWNRIGDRLR